MHISRFYLYQGGRLTLAINDEGEIKTLTWGSGYGSQEQPHSEVVISHWTITLSWNNKRRWSISPIVRLSLGGFPPPQCEDSGEDVSLVLAEREIDALMCYSISPAAPWWPVEGVSQRSTSCMRRYDLAPCRTNEWQVPEIHEGQK